MGTVNIKKASEIEADRIGAARNRILSAIDSELNAIDIATIRPTSEALQERMKGNTAAKGNTDRLDVLRDAAKYLRGKYVDVQDAADPESVTIDWPVWRK